MIVHPGARGRLRALAIAIALVIPAQAAAQDAYEQLQAFSAALTDVRLNYVDSTSYSDLVRAAIAGALRSLDPHSRLVTRADFAKREALMSGKLAGTGLSLEVVAGRPTVLAVVSGSPGDRAGIQPGDRVLAINDTSVLGEPVDAIAPRLAGAQGTRIHLQAERGPVVDPDTFRVTLKLAPVKPVDVSEAVFVDSGTALVRLESFERPDAIADLAKVLDDLTRRGMRRLVLDLRGNPGGLMAGASQLAALFLPAHSLVYRTVGRQAFFDTQVVTLDDGKYRDLPLAVLVDEWTASAAETFAGTMQDHDRALLVGRRTFGKALEQRPYPLPNGDVIWLTVARIYLPSGRLIQRPYHGIGPVPYELLAGTGGSAEDSAISYRTDAGRLVRGGGGVQPDSVVRAAVRAPRWWVPAMDSGITVLVADSVAGTLGSRDADRMGWIAGGAAEWRKVLLGPFLAHCRSALHIDPQLDPDQADQAATYLAARTAEVRWGREAKVAVFAAVDPVLHTAVAALRGASPRLAPPRP